MANILQFLAILVCLGVLAVQTAPVQRDKDKEAVGQIVYFAQGQDEKGSFFKYGDDKNTKREEKITLVNYPADPENNQPERNVPSVDGQYEYLTKEGGSVIMGYTADERGSRYNFEFKQKPDE